MWVAGQLLSGIPAVSVLTRYIIFCLAKATVGKQIGDQLWHERWR